MSRNCLETVSWSGEETIFEEVNRIAHEAKHPELRDPTYIQGRVKEAICKPTFVYRDFERPKTRVACYLEEFRCNEVPRYTKVIIDVRHRPWKVLTAFRPTHVKERSRTKRIYGKD